MQEKYNIEQIVFLIHPNKRGYTKTKIVSIIYADTIGAELLEELEIIGYRTELVTFRELDIVYPYELTTNEEYAKHETKFTECVLDKQIWLNAIGDREADDENNIENCELGECCSEISYIRDILIECQENNGLNNREIRNLRDAVRNHDSPTRKENLSKILNIFNITWQ